MADDIILLNLVLNESTVQAVEGRIKNIVNRYNNTPINLNIRGTNLDNVINRLNTIQTQMQSLNNASVNINASLTPSQQQYRLETERLRVSQLTELARQRTLQSENNALSAMAMQNRTLNIQNTVTHQIDQNVNNMGNHMQGARGYAHDFVDYLAHGAAHIATYKTLETIMYNVRDAFREIKDVDTSLISVKKTTGLSDEEIEAMRKSSYSVATEYGRTPSEYLKSVAAFARAGYREQSEELGKISLLAQNVGELSSSASDELLLAVDAAFQLKGEVGALTNVVSGLNAVANKNATDMGKLSEGLKVSASMAKTAGLEISDIVSLIAVGTATTQRSGSEIGRAVRSILMNTTALKGTLEDGEIIDDDSISKTHKALEGVGIQVKEVKDGIEQLRNPMDILNDLADKWDSLNPDAQNILLSDMGQKRHANVLSGIIDNWDMAEKVMGEYFNSANSAVEENTLYLQGWESKSAKVSTKWTEFVTNMVDTSLIKGTLDTLYTAIDILDSPLGRLVTQVVLLNTAFSVTGRLWNMVRARSIVADIMSIGVAERDLGTAVELVNAHLRERLALWVRSPAGIATIGLVGISLVTSAIKAYNQAVEEHKQKLKENAQEASKQAEESAEHAKALLELKTQLDSGTKSTDELTSAFEEQLKAMGYTESEIDTLISKYGGLTKAIEATTESTLRDMRTSAFKSVSDSAKSIIAEYDSSPDLFIDKDSIITTFASGAAGTGNKDLDKQIRGILATSNETSEGWYKAASNSADDILKYYEILLEAKKLVEQEASATNNPELLYSLGYKDIESAINLLSESAELYKNAISSLHEADARIEVSDYLKTNSIDSKESFDSYIESIKNSTEYSKEYKMVLVGVANDVFPQFSNAVKTAGDDLENVAVSLETLKTASESVATLQKAFKELSEDGYITVDTLAEIQKATGLNDEQFEQYKNTLLNAKAGSDEFNDALNELTYKILESKFATTGLENATKEEVAAILRENGVLNANEIAHEAIVKAKMNSLLRSDDFAEKTDEEKIALIDEAMAATTDALAIQHLSFIKDYYNSRDDIDTSAEVTALMEEAQAAGMNAESLVRLAKAKELLEKAEDAKSHKNGFDYQQYMKQAQKLLESPFTFSLLDVNYKNTSSSTSSLPDLPEKIKTTPKEHERDNSYSDFFDEILADRQKARETFEEKDEQLQKELEQALEDLDLESAERIAQAIADNETEYQRILGEQIEQSKNTLNNEILPTIFEIAPELKGKAWEDITEVDKEKIRQGLEQAKLDAENAIIDEENRLQAKLDALETQWNQDSYNRKLANDNKEDEAYKQAEAEFKSKKDALEKDIDAITASDSPLQQALEAAEKQIEAWDGLTNSAEDYAEDIKEIPGLINESQERIEQSSEDLNGGLDDLFSEYERHIDRQTDELQKQADAYDILIDKARALADGSKSMYDSLRNVRQLQRDISKELTTNKALGEYLDEDTRKLLFNEDDYNKLSKKLSGISSDITSINSWYANQINGLTEDNWYLEGAITAEYERRLAMKEKEYEIARAELDLEKKKQELNNILNEKNIRMLTKDAQGNYKWTQIHNVEEASRVAGEIAELEGQIAETRLQATEDSIVNQKQAEADALNAEKLAIEKRIELINKETEELATAVEDITNPLMDFGNLVTQLNAKLGLVTGVSTVRGGSNSSKTKTGGSTSRSEYAGTGWENVEYDPNTDYQAIINDAIARGDKLAAGEAEIKRNLKIEGEGLDIPKTYNYHTDPKKTFDQGGVAKGKGLMFKDTNHDELVLDPVQTGLFEKFIENTKGFDILANQMSNMINSHQMSQIPMNATTNNNRNVTFEGDIVLNNVSEPQDFMGELAKNLRHYVFK